MRSKLLVPALFLAVGCDGRYVLGDLQKNAGGAGDSGGVDVGGVDSGGAAGIGGSGSDSGNVEAGGAGGSSASGDAGAGDTGGEGAAGLVLSPSTVPNARLGVSYRVVFGANGGAGGYAFQVVSGALPTGLTLDANGRLEGVPQEQGAFNFVVEVTDAANAKASAAFEIDVSRTRWLASDTFVSSASTQTVLSLIDLEHPAADPVVLEKQSANDVAFSGDGRWIIYSSFRSTSHYDIYLVDTSGDTPGAPQFLLTGTTSSPCRWAPDSSKVACFEDTGSPDAPVGEVVFFDTSGTTVGPLLPVASVPARAAGAPVNSERELAFVDERTLVFSYGANDFARVVWASPQTTRDPEPLGVGGGIITQQSPDRGRMFIKRVDPNYPLGSVLVDFRLGQAEVVDPKIGLSLSNTFESGISTDPPVDADAGAGTYSYYAIDGIQVTKVGEDPIENGPVLPPRLMGRTFVRVKGGQVVATAIGATSTVEHVVPGDYGNVIVIGLDPTSNWIYIGTADKDAQQQPIEATAKHWLSRLSADGPGAAQLVGQDYLASDFLFSPNGRGLLLHGDDPYPQTNMPVAFRLFDLTDPTQVKPYTLDIPFNWADANWSADATYVSLIGGDPTAQSRRLFVVDALAPSATPRLIVECSLNPAPLPGCPSIATFQP